MKISKDAKKAGIIGFVSTASYIACYYMRHLLSVTTPNIIASGVLTKEIIGTLSSFYLLAYAVGQLINGVLGERVNAKYMVSIGLIASGAASILVPVFDALPLRLVAFLVMGFSLSMLRGPLVKVISENTLPHYARRCCAFLTFAGFLGPMISSALAIIFEWESVFSVAGALSVLIGIIAFCVLSALERRGIIKAGGQREGKVDFKNIFRVFKLRHFVFFVFIGSLTEINSASISFWLPTYMVEYLDFSADMSNVIFSILSVITALVPFVALGVYALFKHNAFAMMKYSFLLASVSFLSLIFIKNSYMNIVVFLIAKIFVSLCTTALWSIYIPSQSKSGMVSTVNGVIDFAGYAVSFFANMIFTFSMAYVGWQGIIAMWGALMLTGSLASFVKDARVKKICEYD